MCVFRLHVVGLLVSHGNPRYTFSLSLSRARVGFRVVAFVLVTLLKIGPFGGIH